MSPAKLVVRVVLVLFAIVLGLSLIVYFSGLLGSKKTSTALSEMPSPDGTLMAQVWENIYDEPLMLDDTISISISKVGEAARSDDKVDDTVFELNIGGDKNLTPIIRWASVDTLDIYVAGSVTKSDFYSKQSYRGIKIEVIAPKISS